MTKPVIMFVGHSHVSTIVHALRKRTSPLAFDVHLTNVIGRPEFVNYAAIVDGERVFNPAIVAEMEEAVPSARQDMFVGMFGGNAYNAIGIFREDPDYDFDAWGEPDDPGLARRPAAQVRSRLLEEAVAAIEHITLLRQTKRQPMVILCSPPPIEDNDFISSNLGPALLDIRNGRDIARPLLRKKLYLQHSEIFRTHCGMLGLPFIGPPAQAVTENGYLKPEYWSDATHANGAYGDLQLAQVEEFARNAVGPAGLDHGK